MSSRPPAIPPTELTLARNEVNVRLLMQKVPIALSHISGDLKVLAVNDRFVELFGYTLDDLPTLEAWWPCAYPDPAYRQELQLTWEAMAQKAMEEGTELPPLEVRVTCKNGEERIVEIASIPLADGLVTSFVDLTERKRAEEVQKRLNRELRAISDCNQAVLRAEDEQTLLDQICHIVCEEAGYRMAWVGYAEHDAAMTVRPRAWAGEEAGYLSLSRLTWADTPAGQRPFGIAIRSGDTSYAQDFTSTAWSASWTAQALQRGYRCGIALPLKNDQSETFGALCIYSTRTNAFTAHEIKLLEGLAGDLAFGITSLRLRAKQDEAKQQLAASEQLFRALVENSPDPIARYDRELHRVYVNPAIRNLFKEPIERVLGESPAGASPLIDPDSYVAAIKRAIETREECRHEGGYRTLDGKVRWSSWRFTPEFSADGNVATVLVISGDITELRQAEEERQAHLHFLECMDRVNRAIQGASDLEQMMRDVLDQVLSIFDCDRAFLLHPCEPTAASWGVPMERTKPEYPGVLELGLEIPMDPGVAQTLQTLLDTPGPVRFGAGTAHPLPALAAAQFGFKSILSIAIWPKHGKPWQFGIHQCSRARAWTEREVRLFEEIAHRIADGLTSLLITRNLRESEQRFRMVFENSPLPIQEKDFSAVKARLDALKSAHGEALDDYLIEHPQVVRQCAELVRVIDVNRAALSLHEAAGKDLLAQMSQVFTAESYPAFRRQLVAMAAGRTDLIFDSAIQTLAGDRREVTVYWSVCPGYEQSLGKVIVSLIDITERKRTEAELAQYHRHLEELVAERTRALIQTEARASHILQSSADGLYGVDRSGNITFMNPAACQLLGYTAEELIGRSAHATFHHKRPDGSPYPVEECPSHAAILSGREIRLDNETYWHADGHALPVMFAVHPMTQDGTSGGAVISFVDMSEQRAAALAREKAVIAAENLARVRSEFLANMSHEIRTPINGVLGFAEIGYRHYQNSDKARNAFEKILTSGKVLLGVINDILDFSKIEAGKLGIERTTVALNDVIEQAMDVVQGRARAKQVDLRLQRPPDFPRACLGDPLRIGQVLLNLLSNAVKFTESGSVTLTVSCQDDTLSFKVTDTGIGMSEAQLGRLFAPFEQADGSTTRRFGGTGLGLTIAKRIAELLGGDIRVESRLGTGSSFEFRLPYLPAGLDASPTRYQAGDGGPRLAGIAILVAEDEPINQMMLQENLLEDGASVIMVSNGREAVDRVRQDGSGAYDIVLMDVQMPVMDGLEATRLILELAPRLPVIGQTAYALPEERKRCLAAGMVGHIAKPIDPDALVALVLQHTGREAGDTAAAGATAT